MKLAVKIGGGVVALLMIIGVLGYIYKDSFVSWFFAPTDTELTQGVQMTDVDTKDPDVEAVAQNLNIPWEIAFLPNNDMLVTERPGKLKRIDEETQRETTVSGVAHRGEGGLLGLALHPRFAENRQLYLYMTTEVEGGLENRVVRYRYEEDTLSNPRVIIDGIPGAPFHDGGRMAFGPDRKLYITVGDATDPRSAQNIDSVAGSVLRLNPDGSIPPENPFGNAVYSYGHRNAQGLAWDEQGRLWATEHGNSARDEINLIEYGVNYGWPVIRGSERRREMRTPVKHSGADETWAPSGATFLKGSLFFVGLRGESLYEARIEGKRVVRVIGHFRKDYGRLRTAVTGPEGNLYVVTNNRDGRGQPNENDDQILKIDSGVFEKK